TRIGAGDACLQETPASAVVTPFSVTLVNGQTLVDGAGQTLEYSVSGGGGITLTFDRPLIYSGFGGGPGPAPYVRDSDGEYHDSTGSADHTVYTISAGSLNGIEVGEL